MENKSHKKNRNYTLVLFENGSNFHKQVERMETKSIRRFHTRLRLLPPQIECYLRVHYPDGGHNDGCYTDKEDLLMAFEAFCED